jgi:protein-L-isoaspartate(D-aspartate) O-methyltransferase
MDQSPATNKHPWLACTFLLAFLPLAATTSLAMAADDPAPRVEASQPTAEGAATQSPPAPDPAAPPAVISPPRDSVRGFVQFMKNHRQEHDKFLEQRYQRCTTLIQNKDLVRDKEIRAFLLTPREKFCRSWNQNRAYDHAFLDIHYGVTISGPHLVGRMTSALDVQPGDKVLEIGTGSGYQAALLRNLTDQVYTIEIIEALEQETDRLFGELTAGAYHEYGHIKRKADDGYYGWEEYAPFDKIIVTCGIDHIPPPLLKQLKAGGSMVIPVGPPGAQVVLKVTKNLDARGNLVIAREDIYHGRKKEAFVPFTKKEGGTHFK